MLSVLVTEVYDEYILVIDTNDINHIKNVFRKEKGDIVRAVDGSNEYLCEIEEINDKEIKLKIIEKKADTIAKEALKQCQGVVPTVVDEIKKIDKLNLKDYDLVLVPYENEEEIFLKDILRNLKVKPSKILYIIGAEGGFEKEEIDFLKSQGAKIISLGKRILRAETAAIVTGGVIINEFF